MNLLLEIATRVRSRVERLAIKRGYTNPRHLNGFCAIAAGELWKELRKVGLDPKIANNDDHAFILLEDKIVDLTASQFDYMLRRVEIRELERPSRKYFWEPLYIHSDVRSFRQHQKAAGWPKEQWALLRSR